MSHSTALPLLVSAALLLTSCGSASSPTKPTTFASASSVSISAKPLAFTRVVSSFGCPAATPFTMPFLVTVTPTGAVGLAVTSITTQFTDFLRVQAPAVTLPAPVPTVQFGSALDQARGQSFSMDVCRTDRSGIVVVIVTTLDGLGRSTSGTISVAVN